MRLPTPPLSHTHPIPQYGELLMLAAGTGLAPMVPILHSITDNADDETFVTLVSCFKTFEGIYLKTFLQEQARFWNLLCTQPGKPRVVTPFPN